MQRKRGGLGEERLKKKEEGYRRSDRRGEFKLRGGGRNITKRISINQKREKNLTWERVFKRKGQQGKKRTLIKVLPCRRWKVLRGKDNIGQAERIR